MVGRLYPYDWLVERGLTRARIRDGLLIRVARGVYLRGEPSAAIDLRALFLRLSDDALLSHWSAAHRFGFAAQPAKVHVLVPAGRARPEIDGVVTHEGVVMPAGSTLVGGVPAVSPARAAIDVAKLEGRLDAIATLDAALRAGACDAEELAAEVARHGGLKGVRQARELVALADGRAECAQESHLRLILVDGGLPTPEPQHWVLDDQGIGRYRLDLAYGRRRVGLEYDGASHLDRTRLRWDRARMNWLSNRGWRMRYFTADDIYRARSRLLADVRSLLR
ncbi:DUF559 domain-containing protein [Dactylosporangium sp. AC04546]|uniref:DUF559 domain-containing protein n=1 Tax=Dactylosporangium sp. AC04546 TaxID=2862460 RepID=UPI001EE0EBFB|nr:DUF559 domain-containing protein [Dactylosporangium sp. AC04546]WVK82984.1 DUF559 domain-containing protein [Dactylosporangium sp. AC04546]